MDIQQRYLQVLSHGIQDMWQHGFYADVKIVIEDRTFHCHRIILGALSHYFHAMFNSGMRESKEQEVTIQNISSTTFESVLQFVYTGQNIITTENSYTILQAAVMLHIKNLQEQCEEYLLKILGPDNCLVIWKLATSHGCAELKKQSWSYVMENFSDVQKSPEFSLLDQHELISIIDDNCLNASREEMVCDALLSWISANGDEQKSQFPNIFGHLRLDLMSEAYLISLKQNPLVSDSSKCCELVDSAMKNSSGEGREVQASLYRHEEVICVVGTRSRNPDPQKTEVKCCSFRRPKSLFTLASVPIEPGPCAAVCVHHNDIFLSGGYLEQNLLLQFMSAKNQWQDCGRLTHGRWSHAMVGLDNAMYVIGGSTKSNEPLDSIEMYDLDSGKFRVVGHLQLAVSYMSAAAIDQKIYVFGGKLRDRTQTTAIQCFDTETLACTVVAQLPNESGLTRSHAVVHDNSAYIVYREGHIMEFTPGETASLVGKTFNFDHFGVLSRGKHIVIIGSRSSQFNTVLFSPQHHEVQVQEDSIRAPLCNYHCLLMTISRKYFTVDNEEHI